LLLGEKVEKKICLSRRQVELQGRFLDQLALRFTFFQINGDPLDGFSDLLALGLNLRHNLLPSPEKMTGRTDGALPLGYYNQKAPFCKGNSAHDSLGKD
jgi:hypothetical protein